MFVKYMYVDKSNRSGHFDVIIDKRKLHNYMMHVRSRIVCVRLQKTLRSWLKTKLHIW